MRRGTGSQDALASHFAGDHQSFLKVLDLQIQDLRAVTDAELAHELAEATIVGEGDLTDEQLALQLAEAEELRWAQAQHDAAFAQKVAEIPDDEWARTGDWVEEGFDATSAPKPAAMDSGFTGGRCGICMEERGFLTIVGECEHAFCHGCLKQYLVLKVKERAAPITCCAPGCRQQLEPGLVQLVAGQATAVAYERDLAEAAMRNKTYCPYPGCGAAYDLEEGTTEVMCFECRRTFCGSCRVVWHRGMTCQQYQELPEHLRAPEDVALLRTAKRNRWKTCPGCKNLVSKQEGDCNFMRCRCGLAYCFKCGIPYINDEQQANNVHGRAGCDCQLFDAIGEEEEEADEDDEPPAQPVPLGVQARVPVQAQPEWQEQPEPAALVGLVQVGNVRQRRYQFVDLEHYSANLWAGKCKLPNWLAHCLLRNQCCYCAREFPSLAELNLHLQETQQHAVYACCGRIFIDQSSLLQHAEKHRTKKRRPQQ